MKYFLALTLMMVALTACSSEEEVGVDYCSAQYGVSGECPPNHVCVDNRCVESWSDECTPPCDDNEVCGIEKKCIGVNTCHHNACAPTDICVNDYYCVNTIHVEIPCSPECDEQNFCYDGECIPMDSCLITRCNESQICKNHICVEK